MLIGYARVSTPRQDPAHQLDALKAAGVDPGDVFLDVASGSKADRPQLDQATRCLREGDTLVVTRLDRLGRSVSHLVAYADALRTRGVHLRVLEQGIDTTTSEGRLLFHAIAALAEFQADLIRANTRDGLAAARARGRTGGRRPKLSEAQAEQARRLWAGREKSLRQIGALFGVAPSTVYGYVSRTERIPEETEQ